MLAPLGLGASAGTALVLDLAPAGIPLPAPATVADLVRTSPTLDQLRPSRRGVAVLASGGATWEHASELVEAFGTGWPAVVVRVEEAVSVPTVPVVPVMPGVPPCEGPAVYQRTGFFGGETGPGIVLPRPRPSAVRRLVAGRMARGRWVRAWSAVWGRSWT